MRLVRSFRDLEAYRLAFEVAMKIYEISKNFPAEEKYEHIFAMLSTMESKAPAFCNINSAKH
jgi:hypothetical protein